MPINHSQTLHIISLNNPYPPNYGGVIDIYYRVKALSNLGVNIILHCFNYGRSEAKELEKLCSKTFYYPRHLTFKANLTFTPFIVKSRKNDQLLSRLLEDDFPILFDGLHCCGFLSHPKLKNRRKLVRTHNIEHEYYHHISLAEKNPIKKLFFKVEGVRLKRFEHVLSNANYILSISPGDHRYFSKKYKTSRYIPAFIPEVAPVENNNEEPYLLFHGNLSVHENTKSLDFLLNHVFTKINYPVIIAGKNPSSELIKSIKAVSNIKIVPNPDDEQMGTLIANAQCIVLHTFQATGIKLKLLTSLLQGNNCIANNTMVQNTGLEQYCILANSVEEWISAIENNMNKRNQSNKQDRIKGIMKVFDNMASAKEIIQLAYH